MTAPEMLGAMQSSYYNINSREFLIAFWMFRKNINTSDTCYLKVSDKLSLCFDKNLTLQFTMANFLFIMQIKTGNQILKFPI